MIKGNEIILKASKVEASQQTKKKRTVTGTVIDAENGDPIIGASIVLKGQKEGGTITDLDGNFSISITGTKALLEISYIGYKKKTVDVGDLGVINVKLESDNQLLNRDAQKRFKKLLKSCIKSLCLLSLESQKSFAI